MNGCAVVLRSADFLRKVACNQLTEKLTSLRVLMRHARYVFFFFQAEDGIRDDLVTGVQTCALPICGAAGAGGATRWRGRGSLLEDEGHGAVIHQLHLHHRTELAGFHAGPAPRPRPRPRAPLPEERDEPFVQGNRYLGRRRVDEAGPPPLARVAVQGELRHHEQRPAYVGEGQVHLPLGVTEQPQTEHLVRHPGELVLGVGWGEAGEDEKPRSNLPGYAPVNAHFRTRDPLQHDPHRPAPTQTLNGERGTRNRRGAFVEQDLPLLFRVPPSAFRVRLTRPSRFSPGSAAGPRCTPVAPRCSTRAAGAAAP